MSRTRRQARHFVGLPGVSWHGVAKAWLASFLSLRRRQIQIIGRACPAQCSGHIAFRCAGEGGDGLLFSSPMLRHGRPRVLAFLAAVLFGRSRTPTVAACLFGAVRILARFFSWACDSSVRRSQQAVAPSIFENVFASRSTRSSRFWLVAGCFLGSRAAAPVILLLSRRTATT